MNIKKANYIVQNIKWEDILSVPEELKAIKVVLKNTKKLAKKYCAHKKTHEHTYSNSYTTLIKCESITNTICNKCGKLLEEVINGRS